jgi:hypothetical protein
VVELTCMDYTYMRLSCVYTTLHITTERRATKRPPLAKVQRRRAHLVWPAMLTDLSMYNLSYNYTYALSLLQARKTTVSITHCERALHMLQAKRCNHADLVWPAM